MTDNTLGTSQPIPSEMPSSETNLHDAVDVTTDPTGAEQATVSQEVEVEVVDAASTSEPAAEASPAQVDYQATIAALNQELESLKVQLDERTSQCMRIAADFDNYRKRTQKEKEDLEQQSKRSTVVELLPVVDNFERARSQIKPQTESEMNIHKSYQGVYKDLVDRLKRIGVAPMRAEGKEFDPQFHEAVMRETTDEYPEGTVVEELVRGYLLGEQVLRHAMVKVAAAPETVVPSGDDHQADAE
ncbi:MAG TPA: nucleotide exchange factor GrpE [Crinalium sp.]|jgi:molecular chaperone GrpE